MKRRFLAIRLIRSLPAVAGNPRLLFSRIKIVRAEDRAMGSSKGHSHPAKKYIRPVFMFGHLRGNRIPNVLIAWNEPDRRSDGEIVENFHSLFVVSRSRVERQSLDTVLYVIADRVVVIASAKAVILPRLPETVRKQRHATMDSDCTCFRRRVAESCEDSNSVKRLATFQFCGHRGLIICHVKVLRNVLDRTPGSRLVINWEVPSRRTSQKNANGVWNLGQG